MSAGSNSAQQKFEQLPLGGREAAGFVSCDMEVVSLTRLSPAGELYVSDKCGSDGDGDGTEQKPFKTPLKVIKKKYIFFKNLF